MALHTRWQAGTGWDAASGLGRIYGDKFAAAVTEPPPGPPTPPPPGPPVPPPVVTPPTAATLIPVANAAVVAGLKTTAGRFRFPYASVKAVIALAAKDCQASVDSAIQKAMP